MIFKVGDRVKIKAKGDPLRGYAGEVIRVDGDHLPWPVEVKLDEINKRARIANRAAWGSVPYNHEDLVRE